ncbi:glucans biosynthesis glucosyltransferase MdoH [uncultured Thioclava sp.]|uniref:glucans biosynthesis glucosyltransferase MdoH n=1 Tax=uncultured Thioclava sp. TaxID=473858 RepID=UPI0025EE7D60|nr:glucans biosynthesis glucosyltransferase MdoH [uncultured Thioclava sp.]
MTNEPPAWEAEARRRRRLLGLLSGGSICLVGWTIASALIDSTLPVAVSLAFFTCYMTLYVWIAIGFWTAIVGAVRLLRTHGDDRWHPRRNRRAPAPGTRVAVLFPVYHEDMPRVLAGLEVLIRTLRKTPDFDLFDFYVLSDSRNADAWAREQLLPFLFAQEQDLTARLFYRPRGMNQHSKSGNTSDWLRRHGADYDYMVIFDADSIMDGASISEMLRIMEGNPKLGLIQTQPIAVLRDTMFGRLQQFAGRVYGPLFSAGLQYIQMGDGHYIGHNAIIRIGAFIDACGLPILPGRQPFGGHLLSHDFVEAALMARGGWEVWFMPEIQGSYEEIPPTLIDELGRDRRWAQGNTQHLGILLMDNLKSVHRFLFLNGAMGFLAAPIWALFILMNIALFIGINRANTGLSMVEFVISLPRIPVWIGALTLTFLFLPKFLSVAVLARRGEAKHYGGVDKLLCGVIVESVASILIAPVKMLFHSLFVIRALAGSSVKWGVQTRDDRGLSWADAWHAFGTTSFIGLTVWLGLYWLVSSSNMMGALATIGLDPRGASILLWFSPVLGGMTFSVPMAVLTSSLRVGRWLRGRSIFAIPEETLGTPLLDLRPFSDPRLEGVDVFTRVVVDPQINAIHIGLQRLRAPTDAQSRALDKALSDGPAALLDSEKTLLLRHAGAMERLHREAWLDAARGDRWKVREMVAG